MEHVEELFDRQVMDGEEPAQTANGDIGFSLFDAPVLDAREIIIVCEVFVAGVPFLLSQGGQFSADAL